MTAQKALTLFEDLISSYLEDDVQPLTLEIEYRISLEEGEWNPMLRVTYEGYNVSGEPLNYTERWMVQMWEGLLVVRIRNEDEDTYKDYVRYAGWREWNAVTPREK